MIELPRISAPPPGRSSGADGSPRCGRSPPTYLAYHFRWGPTRDRARFRGALLIEAEPQPGSMRRSRYEGEREQQVDWLEFGPPAVAHSPGHDAEQAPQVLARRDLHPICDIATEPNSLVLAMDCRLADRCIHQVADSDPHGVRPDPQPAQETDCRAFAEIGHSKQKMLGPDRPMASRSDSRKASSSTSFACRVNGSWPSARVSPRPATSRRLLAQSLGGHANAVQRRAGDPRPLLHHPDQQMLGANFPLTAAASLGLREHHDRLRWFCEPLEHAQKHPTA